MKLKYLCLISLAVLISLISFSVQNYENSNLKKFLSDLFTRCSIIKSILRWTRFPSDNDTYPSNDIDVNSRKWDRVWRGAGRWLIWRRTTCSRRTTCRRRRRSRSWWQWWKRKKTYVNIKCFWVDKYNVYTLRKLQNKKKDYEKGFEEGKVIFNFCQDTVTNSTLESTFYGKKILHIKMILN